MLCWLRGSEKKRSDQYHNLMLAIHAHGLLPRLFRCFSTQTVQSSGKTWRVSSLGRVCSLNGTVSYGCVHPSGYRYVNMLQKTWPVHRVVMITFNGLPTCEKAWQVHHVDGDRGNNRLTNLEYVTASQNIRYSFDNPARKSNASAISKPVISRPTTSEEWTWHASVKAAASQLSVTHRAVSQSCKTNSPAKGYFFRYVYECEDSRNPSQPGEEWRPMLYPRSGIEVSGRTVSSLGRISSKRGIISRGHLNRMGYHETCVSVNGQYQTIHVHRLVAAVFIGLPQAGSCIHVNHKDLKKSNNAVDNLEYLTLAENASHFHFHASKQRKTGRKPVWSKRYGVDEPWVWHQSVTHAGKELGLSCGNIWECAHGRRKRAGSYEFQLADLSEAHPLSGEEWRDIDMLTLQEDRQSRQWAALSCMPAKFVEIARVQEAHLDCNHCRVCENCIKLREPYWTRLYAPAFTKDPLKPFEDFHQGDKGFTFGGL